MEAQRIPLKDNDARRLATQYVFEAPEGWVCDIHEPKRTLSQNSLLHMWFGEVAKQDDETPDEIKLDWKAHFGVPMLRAEDQEFAAFYEDLKQTVPDPEKRRKSLRYVSISSIMTTSQLRRSSNSFEREYRERGFRLTIPEDRK
jgi:hypothetical protein